MVWFNFVRFQGKETETKPGPIATRQPNISELVDHLRQRLLNYEGLRTYTTYSWDEYHMT